MEILQYRSAMQTYIAYYEITKLDCKVAARISVVKLLIAIIITFYQLKWSICVVTYDFKLSKIIMLKSVKAMDAKGKHFPFLSLG